MPYETSERLLAQPSTLRSGGDSYKRLMLTASALLLPVWRPGKKDLKEVAHAMLMPSRTPLPAAGPSFEGR